MASGGTWTREEFLEFVQGLSKEGNWAEKNGYVGNISVNPVFNLQMSNLRQIKSQLEKELSDIEVDINWAGIRDRLNEVGDEISDLESRFHTLSSDELDTLNSLYDEQSNLNDKADEYNKITGKRLADLEDTNDLMVKANGISLEELKLKARINKLQNEINKELDYQNKKYENTLSMQERMTHFLDGHILNTQKFTGGISEIKSSFSKLSRTVRDLLEPWSKLDQASANYARNIGMSAAGMKQLRGEVIAADNARSIAARTGLSPEEQMKLMGNITEGIGRQIGFNENQQDMTATGAFMFGNDKAQTFIQSLENFGISTSEAMERAHALYKTSANSGVAFSKSSKIFLDNIRMAQNYTFRNGLNGLSEMAKRSAEIKMNMGEVSRFIDKTSTLEGSLQSAAGLSVLGGGFALGANPLQMLYNGLQDAEGAEKHMENMLKGLVTFNQDTKQLEMSAFNRQRMRAAAQAMGVNYDEMMNTAFAMGREQQIRPILDQKNIKQGTDEYQMLVNRSFLDKNGIAKINVNGEEKSLRDLTEDDIKALKSTNVDDSENLRTTAASTRGILDLIKGTKEGIEARRAYQAEVTGIGDKAKSLVEIANENYKTISDILTWVKIIQGSIALLGIGNGMFRAGASLGGMRPPSLSYSPTPANGAPLLQGASIGARRSFANAEYTAARGMGMTTSQAITGTRESLRGAGVGATRSTLGAYGAAARYNIGRSVGTVAGIGVAGLAAGLGGMAISNKGDEDLSSGDQRRYSSGVNKKTTGGILQGAGAGAGIGSMIGMFFGPGGALVGAGIGALAGGIYGGISGHASGTDAKLRAIIAQKAKFNLNGDYSNDELELIANRPSEINSNLRAKMREQDGITDDMLDKYIRLYNPGFRRHANGGILRGRGTGTSDSNLAWLSNNEYIMPAKQVAKPNNRMILDQMRNGADLIPSFKDGGMALQPLGNHMNIMKVSDQTRNSDSKKKTTELSVGEIKIAPLTINGSIKLDAGSYSKSIDAKELLNNPMFIKNITDMIAKNLNKQAHFGYDKDSFYKKF